MRSNPSFTFALLCDAGADGKPLMDLLNDALKQSPPPPEMPVAVTQDGTVVCVSFGKADTAADRKKGGGPAAVPAYTKAMGQVKQGNTAVAYYVDMTKVMAMVDDGMKAAPMPAEIKAKAQAVIDELGVKSLTQMAAVSGFEGKGWSDQGFLGVTGEKKGLLSLLDTTPLTDASLAVVPKDAVSFSIGKLDLAKVYATVRKSVGNVDKETGAQMDQAMAEAALQTTLDIEKDLLAPLGTEWVMYRAPLADVGGLSYTMVHKLRDGEKFAKTLATIEGMVEKMAEGKFKIEKIKVSKIDVSSVSFLQYNVAWAVRNGYLYIMGTLDGIAPAVKQVENKSPSVVENETYKAAMAALPKGIKPISIQYSNPARLYPDLRKTFLGLIALARTAGVDLPAEIMPDADDVAKFMTPGASAIWWDATGLHQMGRGAFPGSEMFSGNTGGDDGRRAAAGAMGTGAMMWVPAPARAAANPAVGNTLP